MPQKAVLIITQRFLRSREQNVLLLPTLEKDEREQVFDRVGDYYYDNANWFFTVSAMPCPPVELEVIRTIIKVHSVLYTSSLRKLILRHI